MSKVMNQLYLGSQLERDQELMAGDPIYDTELANANNKPENIIEIAGQNKGVDENARTTI